MTARAVTVPDGRTIIDPLHVPTGARARMRGLLGRDSLEASEGMWLRRCRMVHTFGMRFAIDLVYLNADNEVCKIVEEVRPGRISACLSAESVIELNRGAARRLGLRAGVCLSIRD